MTTALEVKNLRKIYQNGLVALKDINLSVKQGDFFALLGPNGAGKTTLIGILTSLVNKTSGQVNIFNHNLDIDPEEAKTFIGLVPQEFNFSIFETVEQIVTYQAGYYGIPAKIARQRAEIYLKQLELWNKRHTMSRNLSGGMKRRLMIARALIHQPKLLILDEPTAGVDIEIRRSMWKFLRQLNEQGTTIILTTHYLEEAESLCKHIAIIDQGEIIEHSSMAELLAKLHMETIILYLATPLLNIVNLEAYPSRQVDAKTLEVDIQTPHNLNDLFAQLSKNNIQVTGMKNKVNRLEELFMRLVKKDE
jgi:ABC-2 type transport system ATP-binding protein